MYSTLSFYMAAPFTHIALAERVYPTYFQKNDRNFFLQGTSFPDIRYLGVVERDQTHFSCMTLEECMDNDPFIFGMKVHSFVDNVRNKYMEDRNIPNLYANSIQKIRALKIFEDTIVYQIFKQDKMTFDFLNIPVSPTAMKILPNIQSIERWYAILYEYTFEKPSWKTQQQFLEKIGFNVHAQKEIRDQLEVFAGNNELKLIIESFYSEFFKKTL